MIFVTVGTQLSFDRLLSAVETWAPTQAEEVVAQVGPSKLNFHAVKAHAFLRADEMDTLFAGCSLVIAHAGMGSILSALRFRKPIIIVPRKASLGEHRNEHQLATARWMAGRPGVTVAWEPDEALKLASDRQALANDVQLPEFADPALVGRLREFIHSQ